MNMHEQAKQPDRSEVKAGHLAETVSAKALYIFAGALLIGLLLCIGIAATVMWIYTGTPVLRERRTLPAELPAAGTEHWVFPEADLAKLRLRHEVQLNSYGWAEAEEGIAHIPIDQAMRILAAQTQTPAPPSATQPETSPAGTEPSLPERQQQSRPPTLSPRGAAH